MRKHEARILPDRRVRSSRSWAGTGVEETAAWPQSRWTGPQSGWTAVRLGTAASRACVMKAVVMDCCVPGGTGRGNKDRARP